MLRFDEAIHLSVFLKSILGVILSYNLWRSDVLPFLEFINTVSISVLYIYVSDFFCSIQRIYYLSDFV